MSILVSSPAPVHATLVAHWTGCGWRGILLRGPSGAGKSELALRLIMQGWRLVADDRVILWRSGHEVFGRAPDALAGLIEVRTLGVPAMRRLDFCVIARVVECVPDSASLERIPALAMTDLCGVAMPSARLDARSVSAAEKVAAFCGATRL